jgi:hypothetical protein
LAIIAVRVANAVPTARIPTTTPLSADVKILNAETSTV